MKVKMPANVNFNSCHAFKDVMRADLKLNYL